MQKKKAFNVCILSLLVLAGSLASVMYALGYSEKRELIYSNKVTLEGKEVKFRAFYLSAPAGLFEVKTVSKGTIKWTPHSTVMFEDTLGWFPCKVGGKMMGTIQRWVCETNDEVVRWSVDPENVDMVWYLNIFNNDFYEKEVHIEVKVWEGQKYQDWM
jgi:hypothetical protein